MSTSREDAKDSHEFCKHHAFCRGSYGPPHNADASTAQHQPSSRLRVQKTLSMSNSREDAKTRRIRMKFANIMRSAAAATARPTRLMPQLHNTNPLHDFAASRLRVQKTLSMSTSREDAKDSHEKCKHHAFCRGSYGPTHNADASTAQH